MFCYKDMNLSIVERMGVAKSILKKFLSFKNVKKQTPHKRYHEQIKKLTFRKEYRIAMKSINQILEQAEMDHADAQEIQALIQYMIHMICNDIQYDCICDILYSENNETMFDEFRCNSIFPEVYFDQNGLRCTIASDDNMQTVDFEKDAVFVIPRKRQRLSRNVIYLEKVAFAFDNRNHFGIYFPQIQSCYVFNGNHSVAAGLKKRKGTIQVPVYDMQPLFEHVTTDGAAWYCIHTNEKLENVVDFRFAILFELVRKIDNI